MKGVSSQKREKTSQEDGAWRSQLWNQNSLAAERPKDLLYRKETSGVLPFFWNLGISAETVPCDTFFRSFQHSMEVFQFKGCTD